MVKLRLRLDIHQGLILGSTRMVFVERVLLSIMTALNDQNPSQVDIDDGWDLKGRKHANSVHFGINA